MSYKSKFTGEEIDSLLTEVQEGKGGLDPDGYYPELTVGMSDDLVGRGESIPAEFSFRASGGKSIKDGTARIKRLKGNSVVWNQGYPYPKFTKESNWAVNGIATASTSDKGVTITLTGNPDVSYAGYLAVSFKYVKGHKFLVSMDATCAHGGDFVIDSSSRMQEGNVVVNVSPNQLTHIAAILTSAITDSESILNLYPSLVSSGYVAGDTFTINNLVYHDLTLMFGAGNEPTTIEEYNARKPIVADEYAYNEGEVIHMTAEGIKSIGDNAWDEEWELGYINPGNGNESDSSSYIRSKNYCRIIGGEEYYLKHTTGGDDSDAKMFIVLYDENHSYLDYWGIPETGRTIQFDSRAQYFKVSFRDTYGTTYKNDVLISLYHSGWKADADAKYQPYWEDRLMFDKRIKDAFPNGMQKWDMVYNKNGKGYIVKGTGVVEDMSLLNWETGFGGFHTSNIRHNIKHLYEYIPSNILCSRLATNLVSSDDVGIALIYGGSADYPYNGNIKIVGYDSLNSLLADLQGIPLYYELAEPTIIEYDEPFNLDYRVADFGTEEIIAKQPSAPISADIIYQFNAVDMIREHELEITELQRIIATMQAQLASLTSNNNN